jgi:hypothetical protein
VKTRLLTAAISAVLLLFFAVPLGFMFYGAAGAVHGLLIIGGLIALQAPLFYLCIKLGLIPKVQRVGCVKSSEHTKS